MVETRRRSIQLNKAPPNTGASRTNDDQSIREDSISDTTEGNSYLREVITDPTLLFEQFKKQLLEMQPESDESETDSQGGSNEDAVKKKKTTMRVVDDPEANKLAELENLAQNKDFHTNAMLAEDAVPEAEQKVPMKKQEANLPRHLPENLVYWNRCETRVDAQKSEFVTPKIIINFTKTNLEQFQDPVKREQAMDTFPYLKHKDKWADPSKEQFTTPIEKKVFESYQWKTALDKDGIEGYIILENPYETDILFNSRFESGNLKQAFRSPRDEDYIEVEEEEQIPEYYPPDLRAAILEDMAERKEKRRLEAEKRQKRAREEKLLVERKVLELQGMPAVEEEQYESSKLTSHLETKAEEKPPLEPKKKKRIDTEYNLYLQDDTNSDSSLTQWFYFSTMNVKAGTTVRMNLQNLSKPDSLYAKGMMPFVYSVKKKVATGVGWHRGGEHVRYFFDDKAARCNKKTLDAAWIANDEGARISDAEGKFKKLMTLSFEYHYAYEGDIVFFAHFQPYTYTDMINFLCQLDCDEKLKEIMRIDYICDSLGKTPLYGLTITNQIDTEYVAQDKERYKFQNFEYKGTRVKPKKAKQLQIWSESEEEEKDQAEENQDEVTELSKLPPLSPSKKGSNALNSLETDTYFLSESSGRTGMTGLTSLRKHLLKSNEDDDDFLTQKDSSNTEVKSDEEKPQKPVKEPTYVDKLYRKHIFITARVHPGETQSSHMVHGIIEFLLSDDAEAAEIREKFVIKVIPMLNPDGVIKGNYRVSQMGVDLNRRWKNPSKFLHPTIYYTKRLIQYFNEKSRQPDCDSGGVVIFTDLHGHSRNMDLFMYGCNDNLGTTESRINNMIIRAAPDAVDRVIPIFNLRECKFALQKEKDTTARIVLFKEFGILNSYTLESTFYGSEYFRRTKVSLMALVDKILIDAQHKRYGVEPNRQDIHIDEAILRIMGADFLKGINYGAKRRPLLKYWFRIPPKVTYDIQTQIAEAEELGEGQEGDLKDLEARWRPTGEVRHNKMESVGGDVYIPDPYQQGVGLSNVLRDGNLKVPAQKFSFNQKSSDLKKKVAGLTNLRKESSFKGQMNLDLEDVGAKGNNPSVFKKQAGSKWNKTRKKGSANKVSNIPGARVTNQSKGSNKEKSLFAVPDRESSFRKSPKPGPFDDRDETNEVMFDTTPKGFDSDSATASMSKLSGHHTPKKSKRQRRQKVPIYSSHKGDSTVKEESPSSEEGEDEHSEQETGSEQDGSENSRLINMPSPVSFGADSSSQKGKKKRKIISPNKKVSKEIKKFNIELAVPDGELADADHNVQVQFTSSDLEKIARERGASTKKTLKLEEEQSIGSGQDVASEALLEISHQELMDDTRTQMLIQENKKKIMEQSSSGAAFKVDIVNNSVTSKDDKEFSEGGLYESFDQKTSQAKITLPAIRGRQTIRQQASPVFSESKISQDPQVFAQHLLETVSSVKLRTLRKEMQKNFTPEKKMFAPKNAVFQSSQIVQYPELALNRRDIHFMQENEGLTNRYQKQQISLPNSNVSSNQVSRTVLNTKANRLSKDLKEVLPTETGDEFQAGFTIRDHVDSQLNYFKQMIQNIDEQPSRQKKLPFGSKSKSNSVIREQPSIILKALDQLDGFGVEIDQADDDQGYRNRVQRRVRKQQAQMLEEISVKTYQLQSIVKRLALGENRLMVQSPRQCPKRTFQLPSVSKRVTSQSPPRKVSPGKLRKTVRLDQRDSSFTDVKLQWPIAPQYRL